MIDYLVRSATKSKIKESLLRIEQSESIPKIRIKITFNSNDGLKFYVMNGAELIRQDSIYKLLEFNEQSKGDKDKVAKAETKLRDMFQDISIEKKSFINDIDVRFYLKEKKLSLYLFLQNKATEELNIDNYL